MPQGGPLAASRPPARTKNAASVHRRRTARPECRRSRTGKGRAGRSGSGSGAQRSCGEPRAAGFHAGRIADDAQDAALRQRV